MPLKKEGGSEKPKIKSLVDQEKKQLDDIQKKSQEIKLAIEKGNVIQTESDRG